MSQNQNISEKIEKEPISEEKGSGKRESHWGMIMAWIFVISLLSIVGLQLARSSKTSAVRGDPAPLFTIVSFDNEEFSLLELRGKVVLINFWASWCTPCEDEAQELQDAWEYYEEGGEVVFLGIDYADTEIKALAFIEKFGITYPNAPDLGTTMAQIYRLRGVPETFIVDQEGNLYFILAGPFQSAADIIALIDPLLSK